jgi:hypothetical protein
LPVFHFGSRVPPGKTAVRWTESAFPVGFAVTAEGLYYGAPQHTADPWFIRFFSFSTGRRNPLSSSQQSSGRFKPEMSVSPDHGTLSSTSTTSLPEISAGSRLQSVATMTIPLQICGEALHSQIPPESFRRHWDCDTAIPPTRFAVLILNRMRKSVQPGRLRFRAQSA